MRRIAGAGLAAIVIGLTACNASDAEQNANQRTSEAEEDGVRSTYESPTADKDALFAEAFYGRWDSTIVDMEKAMERGHAALKNGQRARAADYHSTAAAMAADMWVSILEKRMPGLGGYLAMKTQDLLDAAIDGNQDAANGLRFGDNDLVANAGFEFQSYKSLREDIKEVLGR